MRRLTFVVVNLSTPFAARAKLYSIVWPDEKLNQGGLGTEPRGSPGSLQLSADPKDCREESSHACPEHAQRGEVEIALATVGRPFGWITPAVGSWIHGGDPPSAAGFLLKELDGCHVAPPSAVST